MLSKDLHSCRHLWVSFQHSFFRLPREIKLERPTCSNWHIHCHLCRSPPHSKALQSSPFPEHLFKKCMCFCKDREQICNQKPERDRRHYLVTNPDTELRQKCTHSWCTVWSESLFTPWTISHPYSWRSIDVHHVPRPDCGPNCKSFTYDNPSIISTLFAGNHTSPEVCVGLSVTEQTQKTVL